MDKRTLLAFALMIGVYIAWSTFFLPSPEEVANNAIEAEFTEDAPSRPLPDESFESTRAAETTPIESPATSTPLEDADVRAVPSAQVSPGAGWIGAAAADRGSPVRVETDLFIAEFDRIGADLLSWKLKTYTTLDGSLVDLVQEQALDYGSQRAHALALSFEDRRVSLDTVAFVPSRESLSLNVDESLGSLEFVARTQGGEELRLTLSFDNAMPGFDVALEYVALDVLSSPVALSVDWPGGIASSEPDSTMEYREFRAFTKVGEDIEKKKFQDLAKDGGEKGRASYSGTVHYAGASSQYFATAVVARDGENSGGRVSFDGDASRSLQTFQIELPVQRAQRSSVGYGVFMGPMDAVAMAHFDAAPYSANLSRMIDLGPAIFRPFAAIVLLTIQYMYKVIPNYGLVIIIFSILTKLAFYPLTKSSTRSMKRMQEIQPHIAKMKEKYKDDQGRQSQEMMKLYKEHGVNPVGGCLPLLLQSPVFIALFQVLRRTIEMRQAPFTLWMQDLSRPDILFNLPFTLPVLGSHFSVLPFLMAAGMWAQTKVQGPMAPAGDGPMAMNAKMMTTFMPIMMFFFFYNSPSGLVLYWLVNTILTAWQTYRIHNSAPSSIVDAGAPA